MVIKLAICLCYYIFSATPTTDILRLLRGSITPINTRNSYCDACGHVIHHWEQLPVISYILHKGSCRYCGAMIPVQSVFLEGFTFAMMVGVTAAFQFRVVGVALSFLGYELLKVAFLLRYGVREKAFGRELAVSLAFNIVTFMLIAFISWIGIALQ